MSIKYPDRRTEVLQSMRYDPVRAFIRDRQIRFGWSKPSIYWMTPNVADYETVGAIMDNANKTLTRKITVDRWPPMTLEEYQKVCDIIFGE
jgi:hypothetical protein